jgi:hypothetical protein
MPSNSYESVLITAQGDGAALASSTTATSLLPASAKTKIWPNFFGSTEKMIRIWAHGRISTLVTTPGTLTLDVRFIDSAATTVVVMNGGAMTLNIVAKTNVTWWLEIIASCRLIGSSATLFGTGKWTSEAVIGAAAPTAGGAPCHLLPYNTAPAVGTAFDATLEQRIDLFGTWSVNSGSNSITLHQFMVESLN